MIAINNADEREKRERMNSKQASEREEKFKNVITMTN